MTERLLKKVYIIMFEYVDYVLYVCKLLCKRCILAPMYVCMYADTIFVYVYKYVCF